MDENNKALLNELINDSLEYVKEHPDDDKEVDKLKTMMSMSVAQYRWDTQYWNGADSIKNEAELREKEIELQKKELELREKELEETKRYHRGDIASKLVGTAAATGTAILAIKWESVGEFIHGIALKIGPRFRS